MKRASSVELSQTFRQLGSMFGAGIPLTRALTVCARSGPESLRAPLSRVVQTVSQGSRLSAALQPFKADFGEMSIELIRVGENSGGLHRILLQLADYQEKQHRLRLRLRSALMYPLFMFVLGGLLIVALPGLLLGDIFTFLAQLGGRPPWITRAILALSTLAGNPLVWLVSGLLAGGGWKALRPWLRTPEGESRLLQLWVVGPCLRLTAVALFGRALEVLYCSGTPILGALEAAARSTGSRLLEQEAGAAKERLKGGMALSQALEITELFPPAFVHLVAAGEQVGKLDHMLQRASELSEEQLDYRLTVAMAALEPAMLGIFGVLVGILVIGVISPLVTIMDSLS
jgi:type II secretory pathway component PulF